LLLARTSRAQDVARKTDGMSLFLVDLREAGPSIDVRPIETMINHETNTLFISDLRLPSDALVGEEGAGFRQVLDGLNAERILIASQSVGDARWFVDRCVTYAGERVVFGRPIGANQGVQFPIARAFMHARAAAMLRWQAASLFDAGKPCGAEANMAKLLASEAAWEAADVAMTTFGGSGMAVEVGIERKFREARLYLVAPVTNNLVTAYVAEHVLGLPRSYERGGST
jgi:acyl-CoA dehydrogenase